MNLLNFIFSIVYRRWLWCEFTQRHDRVIRVKGWRTAIVESAGKRRHTMSPCFLWFTSMTMMVATAANAGIAYSFPQ
jgi:hypothetical protein